MANSYFRFKQFTVYQEQAAMKVTTDACLFGAWVADELHSRTLPSSTRLLDAGTGTGLLSLMIAQQSNGTIDAVEIDQEAAQQATGNFAASVWKDRLNVITGDLRDIAAPSSYQIIVSNPPFYENELSGPDNRKNIAHHGEGLLLDELINTIHKLITDNGNFYLLYPFKRIDELTAAIAAAGLFIHKTCYVRQSVKHGFFRVMIRGGVTEKEMTKEEISIRDAENNYTTFFKELLSPYYLYL